VDPLIILVENGRLKARTIEGLSQFIQKVRAGEKNAVLILESEDNAKISLFSLTEKKPVEPLTEGVKIEVKALSTETL
jgi:hypothetical protein